MEQIYQTYLNIIKNICTDSNDPVSVIPEQLPALANLSQLLIQWFLVLLIITS